VGNTATTVTTGSIQEIAKYNIYNLYILVHCVFYLVCFYHCVFVCEFCVYVSYCLVGVINDDDDDSRQLLRQGPIGLSGYRLRSSEAVTAIRVTYQVRPQSAAPVPEDPQKHVRP